jgi:hypothetical protein
VTITLALQDNVPASALRRMRGWLYAGDDPSFELAELERVSIADAKMAAAAELRDPYLDAIGQLSRLNASAEWWASHLAAKQPYPSLFSRVCGLAAALELATDNTLIVCSTLAQLEELRRALGRTRVVGVSHARVRQEARRAVRQVAWSGLQRFGDLAPEPLLWRAAGVGRLAQFALERSPGYTGRALRSMGAIPLRGFEGAGTALLVTWIDRRSFGPSGEFRDPHLGPLATMLRERGLRVVNLAKALPHESFARSVRMMLASGEPATFPELYLSSADLRSCERRVGRWRPEIPPELSVGQVPLAGLAREYLSEHGRHQVQALMHSVLMGHLASAGVRPELIVLPWEGHAWEQSLTYGVNHSMEGATVVGYDNLNFSRLALSLYPSALELDLRPLPDRVVANGPTFAEVLGSSAFPRERIRVGCALRHADMAVGESPPDPDPSFILAACSIDAAQSIELLRKASSAFGDQLVARLHPASDARAIRAAVPGVRFAGESLTELLPRARMMLYTYSVVAYEALAAGVPPVFVRSESMLDADQLDPTPDVRWVARTPAELRAVAGQIEALPDRGVWTLRAHEVVRSALKPVTGECVDAFLS